MNRTPTGIRSGQRVPDPLDPERHPLGCMLIGYNCSFWINKHKDCPLPHVDDHVCPLAHSSATATPDPSPTKEPKP